MIRRTVPLPTPAKPELLGQALNPSLFARKTLSFEPDETQTQVLAEVPRRLMLNCNRQWGKSTICAILLAHRAVFVPDSLSIVAGPSERQSAETLRKTVAFLHRAGIRTASDKVNRRSIVLPNNGARIVALPSSDAKIRGFSRVSLLVVDEASRVPDPLYYALRPALATSDGDIALVSTPFGKRGFFYQEFMSDGTRWKRFTVPASDCPRISDEFLNEERSIGDEYYAQEYECQFIEDGRFLITDADRKGLFKSDIDPLNLRDKNVEAWAHAMKPPPKILR